MPSAEEIAAALEAHKAWLRGDVVNGRRFVAKDLGSTAETDHADERDSERVDLSSACLRDADLRRSDLCDAELSFVNARNAKFAGAENLESVIWRGADLTSAKGLDTALWQDNRNALDQVAGIARNIFLTLVAVIVFSVMTAWSTSDRVILLSATTLELPIVGIDVGVTPFLYVAPALILCFQIYLYLYLSRFWSIFAELPHRFPNGTVRDRGASGWIVTAASYLHTPSVGVEDRWTAWRRRSTALVPTFLIWLLPAVGLLVFLIRCIPLQDGCLFWYLGALLLISTGLAAYSIVSFRAKLTAWERAKRWAPAMYALLVQVLVLFVIWELMPSGGRGYFTESIFDDGWLSDLSPIFCANLMLEREDAAVLSQQKKIPEKCFYTKLNRPLPVSNELMGDSVVGVVARGVSFAGFDLSESDFRFADLVRADFSGANIKHADFRGADLSGADFTNALIVDSNFGGADLDGATFTCAEMSFIEFKQDNAGMGHEMRGISFEKARLTNVIFDHARMLDGNFEGSQLSNVVFKNTDMSGALFGQSEIKTGKFDQCTLASANFSDVNFVDTRFAQSVLNGARFTRASFRCDDDPISRCETSKERCISFDESIMFHASFSNCLGNLGITKALTRSQQLMIARPAHELCDRLPKCPLR